MGTYKIKDIEVLTGIKAHTLRIWEKRYGILTPDRTDTKIRFYSDKDLSCLLNIALLNKNGLKISKIAELPINQIENKVKEIVLNADLNVVTEKLVLALLNMDEQLFATTLTEIYSSLSVRDAMTTYIYPFLERIGVMWTTNSINAAQEHFISNLLRQSIIVETNKLSIKDPEENLGKVVLFLKEDEWHEIGLLIYNYLFKDLGYKTFYLGQSVPTDSLLESLEYINPDLIIASFVKTIEADSIEELLLDIRKVSSAKLIIGGRGVSDIGKLNVSNYSAISSIDELVKII